jgi:hypothetical protein
MNTPPINRYKYYRFPVEIMSHAVWLSFRFYLSYRDVEELLVARGVAVTYEAIRQWCRTCGHSYAKQLRRRRPKLGDTWPMETCASPSMASGIPSGVRWIRTGMCWISSSSLAVTRGPRRHSSASS